MDSHNTTRSIIQEEFENCFFSIHGFVEYLSKQLKKHKLPIITRKTNKISIGEKIGEGELTDVMKGTVDGDDVVFKLFPKINYETKASKNISHIISDIFVMSTINDPNLPKFYGLFIEDEFKSFGFVIEFLNGKTLDNHVLGPIEYNLETEKQEDRIGSNDEILKEPTRKLLISEKEITELLIQLTEIFVRLEDKVFVFKNMLPKNIIVVPVEIHGKKKNKIVLIDYGQSLTSEVDPECRLFRENAKITPIYNPPEGNKNRDDEIRTISTKFDVWSIGCLMIHMFTGVRPWSKYTDISKVYVALKNMPTDVYEKVNPNCIVLPIIKKCCVEKLEERIDSRELLFLLKELHQSL